ncbi:MAG: hypothetical protein ACRDWD_13355 [Acidimicrobiia bacterium]
MLALENPIVAGEHHNGIGKALSGVQRSEHVDDRVVEPKKFAHTQDLSCANHLELSSVMGESDWIHVACR